MTRFSATTLLLVGLVLPARADVTVESRLTIASVAGTGEGRVVSETAGLKRREERRLALEGQFTPAALETTQVTLARLDQGTLAQLRDADSTYEQRPLAQVLAHFREQAPAALPGVESNLDVRWTVTSASPGGSETIAGYAATPTRIIVRGTGTQKETGQPIELVLTLELWTAKNVPGAAEIRAFDTKYAAAVGLAPDAVEESMAGFGVSRAAVRELGAARAKITGTPVRTVMKVEMPSLGEMMKRLAATMPGGTEGMPDLAGGPLLTSTLEVERVTVGTIAATRFRVPAGYRRRAS